MCNSIIVFLVCWGIIFAESSSEARRHRKFKGVIIVNQILHLDGSATNNGQPAPEYSGVKQGDLLATDDRSSMVVRIPGLGIYRLGPKSKFKLTSFSDRNESRFELLTGELLALYRRTGYHELKTPRGIISVHGNSTFVVTTESKSELICACDGKLHVQNMVPPDEMIRRPLPVTVPPAVLTTGPTPKTGKAETALVQSEGPPPIDAPKVSASTEFSPQAPQQPSPLLSPTPLQQISAIAEVEKPLRTDETLRTQVWDLNIGSQWNHKQVQLSENGIENYSGDALKGHNEKNINELQSLYELP